ncbi:MAG: ribosome silencing factor [Pyrinomonadaceae bacterium]
MENTLREKSLNHEQTAATAATEAKTSFDELDENVKLALRCASEKKAVNLTVLDLREITSFTEFFIIAGATNQRQAQAISDDIQEQVKKQLGERPIRIEGYNNAEWILMDYGDFVVHIFEQKSREFYDLERLWRDARKVQLPENL